jgi:hypothetical protein
MMNDYYLIGGCILYIIGVGCCAYRCSTYKKNQLRCLECLSSSEDEYVSINEV